MLNESSNAELASKDETCGNLTLLWRTNKDGFYEEVWFHGSLRNKPKGWRVKKLDD